MAALPRTNLDDIVNHVFLPPKLPQSADSIPDDSDLRLLDVIVESLKDFERCLSIASHKAALEALVNSFIVSRRIYGTADTISESSLCIALEQLSSGRCGLLTVHVRAQNAAVLIRKMDSSVVFEAFELSARSADVMTTTGRLVRTFPGCAITVDSSTFDKVDFRTTLANTLAKMNLQSVPGMQPQSQKSGKQNDEERDTTHPGIVTELLFAGFLRSIGVASSVSTILKHTRDEVLWSMAKAPWRRSPMWLLIRVTLQLTLSRACTDGDVLYKECMTFVHSHILQQALAHSLSSDMLYCMNAKIVRRLEKLRSPTPSISSTSRAEIQKRLSSSVDVLQQYWTSSQHTSDLSLSQISSCSFGKDTLMYLPEVDDHIRILESRSSASRSTAFSPPSKLAKYESGILPALNNADFSDPEYATSNLLSFEKWVSNALPDWISGELSRNPNGSQCAQLGSLMEQYHNLARGQYSKNPEGSSIMLLTLMELWVACDKAAAAHCPLLSKFSASVPYRILQNLLLPRKDHMRRLREVENYLTVRCNKQLLPTTLLFSCDSSNSFAVQYYEASPLHKSTLATIETHAAQKRREKIIELENSKKEYQRLMDLSESVKECEYYESYNDRDDTWRSIHKSNCQKCDYRNRASALTIRVDEWPLPSDPTKAKALVFELQLPAWFAYWRDAFMYLLHDVLEGEYTTAEPRASYELSDHKQLSKYYARGFPRRIDLLSQAKPYVVTHYRDKVVGKTNKAEVCGANGCNYQYFDTKVGRFFGPCTFNGKSEKLCTYQFPSQLKALQKYIFRPAASPSGPVPNVVLANLHECPQSMTVEEYRDLCTLPLGHEIQWQNMLQQIGMTTVDLRKSETVLMFLQCIYQAGPPNLPNDSILRKSHEVLNAIAFADTLLHNLEEALQRMKENWESSNAVFILSAMASRLLSLNDSPKVQKPCLELLCKARFAAFAWVNVLHSKAQQVESQEDRTTFVAKAMEVALICGMTFDLDETHLATVMAEEQNASMLWQCSMALREGRSIALSNELGGVLALRFQGILHRCYTTGLSGHVGLDDAVSKSWSAYSPSRSWSCLGNGAGYWLMTYSSNSLTGQEVVSVHFNTLTGELLVDGVPLGGAPREYETKPLFKTLFGHAVIQVLPTTVPGMQYSVKKLIEGFAVHLGLDRAPQSGDMDLCVQAHIGGEMYETIPSRLFRGKFPRAFSDDYVHWYDSSRGVIQFRPIKEAWNSTSSAIWTMAKLDGKWQLTKNETALVAMNSNSSKAISKIFTPLALLDRIHCMLDPHGTKMDVEIPSLKLGFQVAQGTSVLQSREFRDMIVDSSPSLGTLVGLESKLMLKHSGNGSRVALIPQGKVSYSKVGVHIGVFVQQESIIKIYPLSVDDKLGRLIDNGRLDCKLYLAYLHALTSFCLPDPLTHKTGTEQAITILQSAAVRSFDRLTQAQVDMLALIARLTTAREYYPQHKRVMQTVSWDSNLGFLSQHVALHEAVKDIFAQWEQMKIFHPDSEVQLPKLANINPELLSRDRIRTAMFRVSSFGAEDHTTFKDIMYSSRDRAQDSRRASDAFIMAKLVESGSRKLHWKAPDCGRLWHMFCNQEKIYGPERTFRWTTLRYDSDWLENCEVWVCQHFAALHKILSNGDECRAHTFDLMMCFSTMAWSNLDRSVLQILPLLLSTGGGISLACRPSGSETLKPVLGKKVLMDVLRNALNAEERPWQQCPEAQLTRLNNETNSAFSNRRQQKCNSNRERHAASFLNALQAQWICEEPSDPKLVDVSLYFRVDNAMASIGAKFKTWFGNYNLSEYLGKVEIAIAALNQESITVPQVPALLPAAARGIQKGYISANDLFARNPPTLLQSYPTLTVNNGHTTSTSSDTSHRLEALLQQLGAATNGSKYEADYVKDLRSSMQSLSTIDDRGAQCQEISVSILNDHLEACKKHVDMLYNDLTNAVSPATGQGYLRTGADIANHWPRVSPMFFLQQLNHHHWHKLPSPWKECITKYALALCALQRAERMVAATDSPADLVKELQNPGHQGWKPQDQPDSLLMEVDSGILIREVQEQIASHMRSPPDGRNSVMQLNMGEGKSSVIVPMVAAGLANGSQLVRVVVAKPQSKQMAQMLISELGGLLGRRVYYLPFSRSLKLSASDAQDVESICRECMDQGGVLLVQPEHILSFKLMAPECYITSKEAVGKLLASTLDFFNRCSRDIVDESDENFSVKFELIYTMGMQRPIEMAPGRWTLLQQVLQLARELTPQVLKMHPQSIEIHEGPGGSFPRLRILEHGGGDSLIQLIANHICTYGLEGFAIARQPQSVRDAVCVYLTKLELDEAEVSAVEDAGSGGFWTPSTDSALLLLRGLLASGVLRFVFGQKRWRVNYGLATRSPPTKLAVPYRAKDSPSPRSEFSHPDVVIALTSLCYYYQGLCDDDLFTALSHLTKSDQANSEYQAWVKDAPSLPIAFRQLQGINLKDRPQCDLQVFPHLRRSKSVVDYFLEHIVFPKEMKEFPQKLSASGWDIGSVKFLPTTGFSGTNDSRALLPLDVFHLDLPSQKHTNALVLDHLLQPVNIVEIMPSIKSTSMTDANRLLNTVMSLTHVPEVILDVGAQILELDNEGVARAWLDMYGPQKDAAVFCNDEDELSVIDRHGGIELLQTSPFASRLDRCLVFLDEAHTRGIDLKLPQHYHAAVTLGANLTKDRLVQACMRMRKLGKGQTVVFCVSEEIKTKITESTSKPATEPITVANVLHWAITETYTETRRSMPLWAVQGQRFVKQNKIWREVVKDGATVLNKECAEKFLEDEAQSLVDRYRPRQDRADTVLTQLDADDDPQSRAIADRCRQFDELQYNSSTLQEEQERELSPEIEQESQVQRPEPAQPESHKVHTHITAFASKGEIVSNSTAYRPAFEALRNTSAAQDFDVAQLAGDRNVLASRDFARTVKAYPGDKSFQQDQYQRPVRWVLSRHTSGNIDTLLIISPVEACAVLRHVASSSNTALHQYMPRCNLVYRPQDELDFYTFPRAARPLVVPRKLAVQLNLFAGQLYISPYNDYLEICQFLGLSAEAAKDGWEVDADGFIVKDEKGRRGGASGLRESPVQFMKSLMSKIRRNGEGISKTHMGRLLEGQVLKPEDFVHDSGDI